MHIEESKQLLCFECKSTNNLRLIKSVYTRHTVQVDMDVCLVECSNCNSKLLIEIFNDGYEQKMYGLIFPSDPTNEHPRLPRNVHRTLLEAHGCLSQSLYLACCLMCRRCLELVCEYHGFDKGRFVDRLRGLHEAGVINREMFEWASSVRELGNRAAHEQEFSPTREETNELFIVVGCLVYFIYSSATANRRWCRKCGHNFTGRENSECFVCGHRIENQG